MSSEDQGGRRLRPVTIAAIAVPVAIAIGVVVGLYATGAFDSGEAAAEGDPGAPATTTTTTLTSTTVVTDADSIELVAAEDTYVDSGEPDVDHGFTSTLRIENDPPEVAQALVRFDVQGIPEGETVSQAVLRVTVERESDAEIEVRLVSGSWDSSTTWANAPTPGELVGTIPPGTAVGSIVEADVTPAVTGNGTVELFLTTQSDDSSEFGSVESSSPPTLAIAWNGAQILAEQPGVPVSAPTTGEESEGTSTTTAARPSVEDLELTGEHVVLVGAGDIADCDNDGAEVTAQLVEAVIDDNDSTFVFTAGDNAYENGTEAEFRECFDPTWGRFKELIRPAIGNHDLSSDDSPGYFSYFGQAAGEPGEGYYSYEAGSWLVIVLNTLCGSAGGCDEGSPQELWLSGLLESSTHECTLAVYHHPMFSSGEHGGEDDARDLFTLLYEAGAEAVLNGHDHNYERFAPQDPDGELDLEGGIRQFVVGTGGKGVDPIPDVEPNSEVRFNEALGVLQLKLFDGAYEWQFISEPGSGFSDEGANSCH